MDNGFGPENKRKMTSGLKDYRNLTIGASCHLTIGASCHYFNDSFTRIKKPDHLAGFKSIFEIC